MIKMIIFYYTEYWEARKHAAINTCQYDVCNMTLLVSLLVEMVIIDGLYWCSGGTEDVKGSCWELNGSRFTALPPTEFHRIGYDYTSYCR